MKEKKKLFGKENPQWKGNKVGYKSLHMYIRTHKPKPEFCEDCKKKTPYDVTNKSGKYKRDLSDWLWLCRSCHMKKDKRLEKLHKNKILNINLQKIEKKRYKDKKTIQQIADEFNVSYCAIWKRLNRRWVYA